MISKEISVLENKMLDLKDLSERLTVCLFPLLRCVHSTDQLIRLVLRDTGLWMKGSECSIQSGPHSLEGT